MAVSNWIERCLAIVLLVVMAGFVSVSPVAAQDIYKTVDNNGNTVYTDQKPSEDAEPVKLKELTVVDPMDLGNEQAVAGASGETASSDEAPDYSLRIVTPGDEESIWNSAYVLTAQVEIGSELPPGALLYYMVDGNVRSSTRAPGVEIDEVYRGEHQFSVELRASDGRVLASAGPVTFFMRQHSRLHPNSG